MEIQDLIILLGSFIAGYVLSAKLAERRQEEYRCRLREARLTIENLEALLDADTEYRERTVALPDWEALFRQLKG